MLPPVVMTLLHCDSQHHGIISLILLKLDSRTSCMQIEEQFQASQSRAIGGGSPAGKAAQKLAVLDLKRATAIGIRMSRLRCAHLHMLLPEALLQRNGFA